MRDLWRTREKDSTMSKRKTGSRNHQRHLQNQKSPLGVWIGAGVMLILIVVAIGWTTATNSTHGTPLKQHPNENDLATLQAAESGSLGRPILVWFHADSCHVCQMLKREGTINALEQQYNGRVDFSMVNIEKPESRTAARTYRVSATPTFVLFDRQGSVVSQFAGWPGTAAVAGVLDQLADQQ